MFGQGEGDIEIIMDDKNIHTSPEAMRNENVTCSSESSIPASSRSEVLDSEMNAKITESEQEPEPYFDANESIVDDGVSSEPQGFVVGDNDSHQEVDAEIEESDGPPIQIPTI
jgi:hypothetical protein